MTRKIFVNLPVADLPRAEAFYGALGFEKNPKFSNDTGACMVWSETIFVMLLTHAKWRQFTERPIPDSGSNEVMLAIGFDSKAEVDRITEAARANGGTADINPKQDHGFMYGRDFLDLDGHIWEAFWMDPAMAAGGAHEAAERTS